VQSVRARHNTAPHLLLLHCLLSLSGRSLKKKGIIAGARLQNAAVQPCLHPSSAHLLPLPATPHTHTHILRTDEGMRLVCARTRHQVTLARSPLAGSERRRHQQAERERERGGATTKPCMHAAAARPRGCCSGGGTCQQHHHTQPNKAITPWCPCGRVVMTGRLTLNHIPFHHLDKAEMRTLCHM
jgi:hypothetical protein